MKKMLITGLAIVSLGLTSLSAFEGMPFEEGFFGPQGQGGQGQGKCKPQGDKKFQQEGKNFQSQREGFGGKFNKQKGERFAKNDMKMKKRGGPDAERVVMDIIRKLELSNKQKISMRNIHIKTRRALEDLRLAMQDKRMLNRFSHFTNDGFDKEGFIAEKADNFESIMRVKAESLYSMIKVLDKEQKKKFFEEIAKLKKKK